VISGGINIYPREIEEVLIRHPDIIDVAVVGLANEKWGESIKAFLVTRNNIDLNLETIRAFCEDRISTIKMPKAVSIIEEIPRNVGGKVLKTSLRKINQ
jgi:acyl-CoA synthetase (AMP-forming)/AMP-acid ligase II